MLPETLLGELNEPEMLRRTVPQETEDTLEHEVASSTLDVYAPEFLPTLTMDCPVVGACSVIFEGDEMSANAQECAAISRPTRRSKFWNRSRPAPLTKAPPRVPQGVPLELSKEQLARRVRSIEIGKETKEYIFHVEQRKLGWPGGEPLTPDPRDSSLSKRSWEREVQHWREELRRRYLLETTGISYGSRPEAASVASTEAEEAQGSEADDAITVNSDDASSTHWSSR